MASKNGFLNEVFAIEYVNWCKAGKLPASASDLVQNTLRLQKEKMKKYHITRKVEPEVGKESDVTKFGYLSPNVSNRQSEHFLSIIRQDLFFRRLTYLLHGEPVYSEYQKDVLVTTATNVKANYDDGQKWPRITDFYIFPHRKLAPISSRAEFLLILFPCVIFTFLYMGYLGELYHHFSLLPLLYTLFGALLFGLIIGFLFWMPYKMFTMMHRAKKRLRTNMPRHKSGKQLYELMHSSDPSFDYEYFYGQLMTMIQAVIYMDGKESLPFYEGSSPLTDLANVIDLDGDLSLKLLKHDVENTVQTLSVKLGVYTYRAKEETVTKQHEYLLVDLTRTPLVTDESGYPFHITKLSLS